MAACTIHGIVKSSGQMRPAKTRNFITLEIIIFANSDLTDCSNNNQSDYEYVDFSVQFHRYAYNIRMRMYICMHSHLHK